MTESTYDTSPEQLKLIQRIYEMGEGSYRQVKALPDGSIAAIGDLIYTRAIYLGCDVWGYARRFCFDDKALADLRFSELVSEDDEPTGGIAKR